MVSWRCAVRNLIGHTYLKKKLKNLWNLTNFQKWLNFSGFWAFSWDRWVLSNFWLHSTNLPIKVLWINTPHANDLTNFFLHFSILYKNLSMQFRKRIQVISKYFFDKSCLFLCITTNLGHPIKIKTKLLLTHHPIKYIINLNSHTAGTFYSNIKYCIYNTYTQPYITK